MDIITITRIGDAKHRTSYLNVQTMEERLFVDDQVNRRADHSAWKGMTGKIQEFERVLISALKASVEKLEFYGSMVTTDQTRIKRNLARCSMNRTRRCLSQYRKTFNL